MSDEWKVELNIIMIEEKSMEKYKTTSLDPKSL